MKTLNINSENNNIINSNKLFDMLVNVTKSTIVAVEYITDDTRSKQVKGLKQVQKQVKISNLYLNHKYENKVRNLTGNSEFEAHELKGKTRISSTIIQSDKTLDNLLDGKILNSESVKLINLFHNNEIITESEAVAKDLWANSFYNPTEKTTSGRGSVSVDDDFKMITLGLSKIIKIKFEGIEYTIQN
jgi:hypothetical protein